MTMRASIILCDFAELDTASGKVHMLGAGWVATGPEPAPHAVVAFISVPPERITSPVLVTLRLTNNAGQVVETPGPGGMQRLEITGQVELRPPPGWDSSTPLGAIFPVNLMMLPLQAGQSYTWAVEIEGKEVASAGFHVRSSPPAQPVAPVILAAPVAPDPLSDEAPQGTL